MTPEKYQELKNTKKFESISFAADYITQIRKMQKEVSIEDFAYITSRVYEEGRIFGQTEILEKYSSLMLEDLKKSYEL